MNRLLPLLATLGLCGCVRIPDTVAPVKEFQLNRYLGKWYEIARLDHSFETGLQQVTAEYSLRPDGGVRVLNRGYSPTTQEWRESEGKAYFVNAPSQGYLKVSFFGPFYGAYVVFELDPDNYQYAFISGPNTSYLWLLSRTPTIDERLLARFVAESGKRGFDTSKLIYVKQP